MWYQVKYVRINAFHLMGNFGQKNTTVIPQKQVQFEVLKSFLYKIEFVYYVFVIIL
jgi:hypothetical protein